MWYYRPYNLNYTPTVLVVQSWREITSEGARTERLNTTAVVHNPIMYDRDSYSGGCEELYLLGYNAV
jgi:hypothetical protein